MKLRPYQEAGRDFLAGRKHAYLGDEMRLGKSAQAVTAAEKAGAQRILVVAPSIAGPVWQREFVRWGGIGASLLGPEGPGDSRVLVASYNRAVAQLPALCARRWDALIVDEAHFAKSPDAMRTAAIYGKDGLAWAAGAVWPLSGTPAPKHAAELWPVMRAFGVTRMSYDSFVRTYCTGYPHERRFRVTGTKESMIPELRETLRTFLLRRTRREVAPELPELEFDFLPIEGRAPEAWEGAPEDDAALMAWLEARHEHDAELRRMVALAKADAVIEHVGLALANDLLPATVVFGMHTEPLERVADACGGALLTGKQSMREREAVQRDFRAGKTRLVCANIQAAGTAIDLSAASHGYFLELSYVPGDNLQAANRLVSLEKHEPVTMDVATWPGSTDDRVQGVLLRRVKQLSKLY